MTATARRTRTRTRTRPVPAGAPRFHAVWNGRSGASRAAAAGSDVARGDAIAAARRGIAAPVLPGRAAIGVLGAPAGALTRAAG